MLRQGPSCRTEHTRSGCSTHEPSASHDWPDAFSHPSCHPHTHTHVYMYSYTHLFVDTCNELPLIALQFISKVSSPNLSTFYNRCLFRVCCARIHMYPPTLPLPLSLAKGAIYCIALTVFYLALCQYLPLPNFALDEYKLEIDTRYE